MLERGAAFGGRVGLTGKGRIVDREQDCGESILCLLVWAMLKVNSYLIRISSCCYQHTPNENDNLLELDITPHWRRRIPLDFLSGNAAQSTDSGIHCCCHLGIEMKNRAIFGDCRLAGIKL